MRELRCRGCGRLIGYTTRPQPVPAQCTDPFCVIDPPVGPNEERDSLITHLVDVEGLTPEAVGEVFGLTRQRVSQVLGKR